jgi:predicted cobalt transporter CbtA
LGVGLIYRKVRAIQSEKVVVIVSGIYAVIMVTLYLALPPNPDAINAPMDLVAGFRIASGFTMSIFWGLLGIIHGAFWDKTKPHEKTKVAMV